MKKIKFFLFPFLMGIVILLPMNTFAASKVKECRYNNNSKILIYSDATAEFINGKGENVLINWNRWIKDRADKTVCPKYIIMTNPIEVGNQSDYITKYAKKHNADYSGLSNELTITSENNSDAKDDIDDALGSFGNISDENSVAWLIQKILNYVKIAGPVLVLILTTIDYLRALIQSDDETMAKINKKLGTRLILIVLLFLIPTLVNAVLTIMGYDISNTKNLK